MSETLEERAKRLVGEENIARIYVMAAESAYEKAEAEYQRASRAADEANAELARSRVGSSLRRDAEQDETLRGEGS